jgi:hypothetical protein
VHQDRAKPVPAQVGNLDLSDREMRHPFWKTFPASLLFRRNADLGTRSNVREMILTFLGVVGVIMNMCTYATISSLAS